MSITHRHNYSKKTVYRYVRLIGLAMICFVDIIAGSIRGFYVISQNISSEYWAQYNYARRAFLCVFYGDLLRV